MNDNEKSFQSDIRCLVDNVSFFKLMTKNIPNLNVTASTQEQMKTENYVKLTYEDFISRHANDPDDYPCLNTNEHIKFLFKGLRNLPTSFECLDSSRPWICYWILHSLYLLNTKFTHDMILK
jgi:prenyltransferase beta subunit